MAWVSVRHIEFVNVEWKKIEFFYKRLVELDKRLHLPLCSIRFIRSPCLEILSVGVPGCLKSLQLYYPPSSLFEKLPKSIESLTIGTISHVDLSGIPPNLRSLRIESLKRSLSFNDDISLSFSKENLPITSLDMRRVKVSLTRWINLLKKSPNLKEIAFSAFFEVFALTGVLMKYIGEMVVIDWEDKSNPLEKLLLKMSDLTFPNLEKLTLRATMDSRFDSTIPEQIDFPILSDKLTSLTLEFSFLITKNCLFESLPVSLRYLKLNKTKGQSETAKLDPLLPPRAKELGEVLLIGGQLLRLDNLRELVLEGYMDIDCANLPFSLRKLHIRFFQKTEATFMRSMKDCPARNLVLEGCELKGSQLSHVKGNIVWLTIDSCPEIEKEHLQLLPNSLRERVLFIPAPETAGLTNLISW